MGARSFRFKVVEGNLGPRDSILPWSFHSIQLLQGSRNWVLTHHAFFAIWNMEVSVNAFEHPVG